MRVGVIILTAGNSTRMGAGTNKVFMKINDKFILEYSIETFLKVDEISDIVVVYNKKDIDNVNSIINKYNNVSFVQGGISRQESLINGINMIDNGVDKVIIHDAARPLIYFDVLRNMINLCFDKKVLIPVRKSNEGVKIIDGDVIMDSINRDIVVFCQTPQIFDKSVIFILKENYDKGVITFLLNRNIKINIYNLEKNILKITTMDDFYYYEYLIGRFYEKNK